MARYFYVGSHLSPYRQSCSSSFRFSALIAAAVFAAGAVAGLGALVWRVGAAVRDFAGFILGRRRTRAASTARRRCARDPRVPQAHMAGTNRPGTNFDGGTRTMKPRCPAHHWIHALIGEGGSYGRLFDLPALDADEAALCFLGAVGGFCDGGDRQADSQTAAGWPFFGQYVAHDLTADRSPLRAHADLAALRNMRSPRANLESLYGGGPVGSPYLYQRDDPAKLLENDGDLPRNQEEIALIGDPRNDTHVLISQMQVAFIGAHNMMVDRFREDGVAEAELFDEARRALVWHYQWLIVNEFLPGVVGPELVAELADTGSSLLPGRIRAVHPG